MHNVVRIILPGRQRRGAWKTAQHENAGSGVDDGREAGERWNRNTSRCDGHGAIVAVRSPYQADDRPPSPAAGTSHTAGPYFIHTA